MLKYSSVSSLLSGWERGGEMAKTGQLGCEAAVGSLTPAKKKEYKVSNRLHEGKRPLYAISFNFIDARYYDVFATVGGNRVTVYRCLEQGLIAVLQAYVDEDKDESFYTLSWACDLDGTPLLVAGGSNGIIRVINAGTEKIHKVSFVGHGDSVNEIRTQPLKPSLVVSASKDESVRLWNVHTGICILIFAGAGGHRNEVLSVVFIASVHSNYVDCTRWLGDFVLSKSVDNEIVLWEPKTKEQSPGEGAVDILQKYPVPECDIWFIKFSCDFHYNAAAIGNREGKIYVWELQSSPPVLIARLAHAQCKSPIRQTALSFDGSTILSCCEDGSIWRWDVVQS
ncbi:polycomb group protein FIE1 isoform X4 [Elaeis guineensis]|uniref:polycomb group protein FIE1 isoform X4 n=1 Tax=Elaeis guineensis var. tenera TaxID=51953 RepID=UPI003C6D0AB3